MPSILGANTLSSSYDVANSVRFNDNDSPSMYKTPGSGGDQRTWTFSTWFKRGNIGTSQWILDAYDGSNDEFHIYISSGNAIGIYTIGGGFGSNLSISTSNLVRDTSAWYHLVVRCDTTQGTASDRLRIYLNGTECSYGAYNNFTENGQGQVSESGTKHWIGRRNAGDYFDGYFAEMVLVDGSSLAPTSFGEFDSDSGIWKPIDVSGLTFGTNGFYLDFQDSANLGNDANGGTDFTEANLAATDQSTDTCTNNSATIGTLFMGLNTPTFSEGNLQSYSSAAGLAVIPSSIGLANGKWYAELKYAATSSNDNTGIGINMDPASSNQENTEQGGYTFGYAASTGGYTPYQGDQSGSGPTYTVGDIMGIYMDLDNMKLYFSKNGTLNSSTGLTINVSNTGFYYFCVQDYTNTSNFWTWQWNFGAGCPFAISSGNTDANGYGNFEYSPTITGDGTSKDFFACNTKNLAEYG
jgi:hypothetical protein